MVASARKAVLEILKARNGMVTLLQLSRALMRQKVLGFGVEPKEVVLALVREGKVRYNGEQEIVSLIPEATKVSVAEATIKVIEAAGGQMAFSKLAHELKCQNVIGGGVEPEYFIREMVSAGKVRYNREQEIVSLIPDGGGTKSHQ